MAIENLIPLTDVERTLFALMLMIGYGAHFAFVPFFLGSATQLAPRLRIVPLMSAVVMISAGLSLLREHMALMETYTWTGEQWLPALPETTTFSNVFRYGNWIITVPILLMQLPLAMDLPRAERHARSVRLVLAGLGMVIAGLIGQFYEVGAEGAYTVWALISTAFYVWLLVEIWGVTSSAAPRLGALGVWARRLFVFMLIAWTVYVVASVATFAFPNGFGVVLRQALYTVADVTSKLIYGVILSRFLLRLSAAEGHADAIEALGTLPETVARTRQRDA